MGPRRHLVIMVKTPVAGRVKTRLARGIGVVPALRFYRAATAALARRVDSGLRWRTVLSVAPDGERGHPVWPAHLTRQPQGRGDLGARMQSAVDRQPPGPVVIIGSDIPGIDAARIAEAFGELGRADVVIGPAPDGGYWLIGFKRAPRSPDIFRNVRWSHPRTLADTLANANAAGLRVALLAPLEDVDEADDLAGVSNWAGRVLLPRAIATRRQHLQATDNGQQEPALVSSG